MGSIYRLDKKEDRVVYVGEDRDVWKRDLTEAIRNAPYDLNKMDIGLFDSENPHKTFCCVDAAIIMFRHLKELGWPAFLCGGASPAFGVAHVWVEVAGKEIECTQKKIIPGLRLWYWLEGFIAVSVEDCLRKIIKHADHPDVAKEAGERIEARYLQGGEKWTQYRD